MTIHAGSALTSNTSSSTSDTACTHDGHVALDHDSLPSVAVVVCVHTEQRWPQIVRALDSVRRQQVAADEIVVVVDHNEALLERAVAAFPDTTVVASTGPRGLSGARNTGVARTSSDVVAFLDDDAEAEPDWLARMLPHYRDRDVLAVGGQAIPAWEKERPGWLPPEFDWVVGCSYTGQPVRVSPVRNLIGCNMSFRRAVLDDVGGFDPALGRVGNIPVGCEETELCIRVQQRHPDGVVLYEPGACVRHRVTTDRATGRYFRRRCFSEGRSKAVVARLVGRQEALSAEREYTRRTLPRGVWRGLRDVRDGDRTGLLRSAMISYGLVTTACGYASAQARRVSQAVDTGAGQPRAKRPEPMRVLSVELSDGVPAVPDRDDPGASRYGAAQVLVRLHGVSLGLVHVDLPAGGLTASAHAAAIADQLGGSVNEHLREDGLPPIDRLMPRTPELDTPCRSRRALPQPAPSVSVVVPTCGRTPWIARTLDALAALDYPNFEIVVVDNAPHLPATARLVAQRAEGEPRLRYTSEPRAGVAHARNRGLAAARGQIVAFADDDVTVDRQWLRTLVDGFADRDVVAVTGQVLASELETPAQLWIEQYGGFGKGRRRMRFDRDSIETVEDGQIRRIATPGSLYPYLPGTYGTGANMAFRTAALRRSGGFDPRLRTGEDIDVLMRLVLTGHTVVYEPGAIVWHAHRRDLGALRRTMFHYGVGLTAVMTKCLAADAAGRRELLGRLPAGIAHALNPRSEKNGRKQDNYPAVLTLLELCGMALGPAYFATAAWSRRHGRNAT